MEFLDLEASSRIVLDDGRVLTRCDQCRQMYAERKPPGLPDCGKLCPVEARVLKEENEDAARIYMVARGQVIVAGDQVIDLNYVAVKTVMDLYGVERQRECFEKVRRCFQHFEKKRRDESK